MSGSVELDLEEIGFSIADTTSGSFVVAMPSVKYLPPIFPAPLIL